MGIRCYHDLLAMAAIAKSSLSMSSLKSSLPGLGILQTSCQVSQIHHIGQHLIPRDWKVGCKRIWTEKLTAGTPKMEVLEDDCPFQRADFPVPAVRFRGGVLLRLKNTPQLAPQRYRKAHSNCAWAHSHAVMVRCKAAGCRGTSSAGPGRWWGGAMPLNQHDYNGHYTAVQQRKLPTIPSNM